MRTDTIFTSTISSSRILSITGGLVRTGYKFIGVLNLLGIIKNITYMSL